jgi:hypothetical protein
MAKKKVKRSAFFAEKFVCDGKNARTLRDEDRGGCGRIFIHNGECPFCKMRLSKL